MDRNAVMLYDTSSLMQSLSARRAWIEISGTAWVQEFPKRRSPQGERG